MECTVGGIRIGCHILGAAERDASSRALQLVDHLVFAHPKAHGWTGVSVRRIEVRLKEM